MKNDDIYYGIPFKYKFSVKDYSRLQRENGKVVVYIHGDKRLLEEAIDFIFGSKVKLTKAEASYEIAGTTGYTLSDGEFVDDVKKKTILIYEE
jgi:hypothetical protein